MSDLEPRILLAPLGEDERRALMESHFGDMFKYVVDVVRGMVAVGGEFHVDAEALLLADGSNQLDVWGANYFPERTPGNRIEYSAMINVFPARGNRGHLISSENVRAKVLDQTTRWIGPA